MKILLSAEHTHGGKPYQRGDVIEVSERQAQWLIEHKRGGLFEPPKRPRNVGAEPSATEPTPNHNVGADSSAQNPKED